MGVRQRQQHSLYPQLLGTGRRMPAQSDIRPAVRRADHLDLAPADPPSGVAPLERFVDRLLGSEPNRDVGRGVRATLAVGALGRREQPLEHARSLVGDDPGPSRSFDQTDADADRGPGPPLRSRGATRAPRGPGGSHPAPTRATPAPRRAAPTAPTMARA